jgi:two-component system, NarL family, invasion response regulator UvrY
MIRILLVDDHAVVRDGVKSMFDEHPDSVIFGEASTPQDAVKLVNAEDWSIMVLDLSLGNRSGLETLKEVKRIRPGLPVLILSMHPEEQYARRAFKAGASGFITKDCARSELLGAIRKVLQGGKYVSPLLAEKLVGDFQSNSDRPPHESLSDREYEVMCLIASGKTVGEIAGILVLSDKTISTYRARILEKMRMKTNAEITRYAIRNNLVD